MSESIVTISEEVAPFTGAWIEMGHACFVSVKSNWSHPSRVRGLKYYLTSTLLYNPVVAPFTGAWIEI